MEDLSNVVYAMGRFFRVVYTIGEGGPDPNSKLGKRICDSFFTLRNKVIEETGLNSMYKEWNEEFDKLYGKRDNYIEYDQYRKFMCDKINEYLKDFNSKGYCVRIEADPDEDGDLVGYFKWPMIVDGKSKVKEIKISALLYPVGVRFKDVKKV